MYTIWEPFQNIVIKQNMFQKNKKWDKAQLVPCVNVIHYIYHMIGEVATQIMLKCVFMCTSIRLDLSIIVRFYVLSAITQALNIIVFNEKCQSINMNITNEEVLLN